MCFSTYLTVKLIHFISNFFRILLYISTWYISTAKNGYLLDKVYQVRL